MKNFYNTLGISTNASIEDIKRAYKKLAMELHPDRNPNNKESEEKMKTINEAYSTLSDIQKRRNYDYKLNINTSNNRFNWNHHQKFDFSDFGSFNTSFYTSSFKSKLNLDINKEITVIFKDLLNGIDYYLNYDQIQLCVNCKTKSYNICTECSGKGYKMDKNPEYYLYGANVEPCSNCNGAGKIKSKCNTCNDGHNTIKERIKINLNIRHKPFNYSIFKNKDKKYLTFKIKIQNQGNEYLENNKYYIGNLFINVISEIPNTIEFDNNFNITQLINLTLTDAWFGCIKQIETIEGSTYNLNIKPKLEKKSITIPYKGINISGVLTSYILNLNIICIIEVNFISFNT